MSLITLFDKSFLQSLNIDESVWLDHYFMTIVCPIFYIETLADLEKEVREGRTPEQEVRLIAEKFPDMNGVPCSHHTKLCIVNLLGNKIPMSGYQIPSEGGKPVKVDGKSGIVFEKSPESEAFFRWQRHEFLEIERLYAKSWRRTLSTLDLKTVKKAFQVLGINSKTCKDLKSAKALADNFINESNKPLERIKLAFHFLNIPFQYHSDIWERWISSGYIPLSIFAPYAAHVLNVEIFFQIALASNLISCDRPSNRIDIAYLFYLPFCLIFVSSDRLHEKCAPLFLKKHQEFIWGQDFKQGLKEINAHYLEFPDSIKEKGLTSFSSKPPKEDNFIIAQIWDRHFPNWRIKDEISTSDISSDTNAKIIGEMNRMSNAIPIDLDEVDFDPTNPDTLTLERIVRRVKGSWYQVPKYLKE